MSKVSDNDAYFVSLVRSGILSISDSGNVVNNITGKEIGFITSGYKRIQMFDSNIAVSRLVYQIYIGSIPKDYVIDHVDGNKLNNSFSNLEAVTPSENLSRAYKMGLISVDPYAYSKRVEGSKNPMAKLSCEDVSVIRSLRLSGHKVKDIAARYNVLPKVVSQIIGGFTYRDCV